MGGMHSEHAQGCLVDAGGAVRVAQCNTTPFPKGNGCVCGLLVAAMSRYAILRRTLASRAKIAGF